MDNIEKLRDKVAKDPTSKLLVPLAEEYRKAGMLDNAIAILKVGLQRQPGYMSARVTLGKIYLEKKMLPEAKDEFEKVVKAIPDNLFAQRKLADVYKELGDKENAIERYKLVLKLNPFDEEVVLFLRELEGQEVPIEAEETIVLPETPPEAEVIAEEEPQEFKWPQEQEKAEELKEEEIPSFEAQEAIAEEMPIFEVAEETVQVMPEAVEEEAIGAVEEVEIKEEAVLEPASIEEAIEEVSMPEAVEEEAIEEVPETAGEEILEAEEETAFWDIGQEQAVKAETPQEIFVEEPGLEQPATDLSVADAFISEGNYYKAMQIYKGILKTNPEDKTVLQRTHELKALLKLLGKDKEILIARLDAFLGAIKKRKDEFFRNT